MPLLPYLANNLNPVFIVPEVPVIIPYPIPLDGFTAFNHKWPLWRLVEIGGGVYTLVYKLITQDQMVGFNPDTFIGSYGQAPNVTRTIKAGNQVPVYIDSVTKVTFDGFDLKFNYAGGTFVVEGKTGIVRKKR